MIVRIVKTSENKGKLLNTLFNPLFSEETVDFLRRVVCRGRGMRRMKRSIVRVMDCNIKDK